jgi:hypothetical protein
VDWKAFWLLTPDFYRSQAVRTCIEALQTAPHQAQESPGKRRWYLGCSVKMVYEKTVGGFERSQLPLAKASGLLLRQRAAPAKL